MSEFAGRPYDRQNWTPGTGPAAHQPPTRWTLLYGQADFDAAGIESALFTDREGDEFRRAVRLLEIVAERNEMVAVANVALRPGHVNLSELNIYRVARATTGYAGQGQTISVGGARLRLWHSRKRRADK